MFTVEIKINGALINHIYGHNEGPSRDYKGTSYRYELYRVESRQVVNGKVVHKPENGINALVVAILKDAEGKEGDLTKPESAVESSH